jgi:2'-5' RNA ligase
MANWFVGFPVTAGPWFDELVANAPREVRVFHRDDLHATIAFLGNCGVERASAAWRTAEGFSSAPVQAVLGALVPMGNPRRPSALSLVLIEGREQAAPIIGALRDAMCDAAGFRRDTRAPLAHITVARPKLRASSQERKTAVAWAESKKPVAAPVVLDRIALYTWSENRKERQFRIVEARPLR